MEMMQDPIETPTVLQPKISNRKLCIHTICVTVNNQTILYKNFINGGKRIMIVAHHQFMMFGYEW